MEESTEPKKLLPIRILEILEKYTDNEHFLTVDQITKLLYEDYGVVFEKKAIRNNLIALQDMFEKDGMKHNVTSIQIEKIEKKGWYLEKRVFEDSELRLLIDGVLASKHIPEKYSKDLIEKLCSLSNKYFKSNVKHVYSVNNWGKTDNKELFYNIDLIDDAIEKGKQITFNYNKFGTDKKLHKTNAHKGSPYQLVLHNQKYYLMFADEKWETVGYVRVEKIKDIKIIQDKIKPIKSFKGFENGIDYKRLSSALPFMFGDEMKTVTMIAKVGVVDDIVDTFGEYAKIRDIGNGEVEVETYTSIMAIEFWAMQYLKNVRIIRPLELKEKIKENMKNALKDY